MRIEIKEHGHQHYRHLIGDVLEWCTTSEKFGETFMQVPCVVVKIDREIISVPLKQEYYWVEIQEISPPSIAYSGRFATWWRAQLSRFGLRR